MKTAYILLLTAVIYSCSYPRNFTPSDRSVKKESVEGENVFSSDKDLTGVSIQIDRDRGMNIMSIRMSIQNKSDTTINYSLKNISATALHRGHSGDPIYNYSSTDTIKLKILDPDINLRNNALASTSGSSQIIEKPHTVIQPNEILSEVVKVEMSSLRIEWLDFIIKLGDDTHKFHLISTRN